MTRTMEKYQYPTDRPKDFIQLSAYRYQARPNRTGGANNQRADALANPVLDIYLPFTDPGNLVSAQRFGQLQGALNNAGATALAAGYDSVLSSINGGGGKTIEEIKAAISNQQGQLQPVLEETASALAGEIVGTTGPAFQGYATGRVSNPNIELLWQGGSLRTYTMNWSLAPKSEKEAQQCYEIVRALKRYHLPESGNADRDSRSGGYLKVPHVWQVRMYVDGTEAEFYQKYFTSFLESVSVRQDSAGSHITLPNGAPVISGIGLVFKEINQTVSEDFLEHI